MIKKLYSLCILAMLVLHPLGINAEPPDNTSLPASSMQGASVVTEKPDAATSANTSGQHAESSVDLDINAQSCILIDSISGQVLYSQNADEKGLYPASTTKIMTAIIALEKGDMDQLMTASKSAVYDIGKDGMNIGIMPGEEIPLYNLLEALLIRSANETANIIAENICSTREEFVELMNQKAIELGALNTHFTNPCGQHDKNHITTAEDMAKIARYAMSFPIFKEIVRKKEFLMPPTNKHSEWPVLATTNEFLKYDSNDLFTVTGIKTGYTDPAGQCLVSSAVNIEGMELIAVVLGAKNPDAKKTIRSDSKRLFTYGFNNFTMEKITESGQVVKENIPVEGAGENAVIDLIAENGLTCVLPTDEDAWDLEAREFINPAISAPVNAGDLMGYIEYVRKGIVLGRVNLVAASTIEKAPEPVRQTVIKEIAGNPFLKKVATTAAIIPVAFLALRLVLRTISRGLRRRKYNRLVR